MSQKSGTLKSYCSSLNEEDNAFWDIAMYVESERKRYVLEFRRSLNGWVKLLWNIDKYTYIHIQLSLNLVEYFHRFEKLTYFQGHSSDPKKGVSVAFFSSESLVSKQNGTEKLLVGIFDFHTGLLQWTWVTKDDLFNVNIIANSRRDPPPEALKDVGLSDLRNTEEWGEVKIHLDVQEVYQNSPLPTNMWDEEAMQRLEPLVALIYYQICMMDIFIFQNISFQNILLLGKVAWHFPL